MEELKKRLLEEEKQEFKGWDFGYMDGKCDWGSLSWDYQEKVNAYRKPEHQLLDLGTGGGEFILQLGHPHGNTSVTEGWEPNFKLCKERLEPLGITVRQVMEDEILPYGEEQFDIVLSRHEAFLANEVWRVLKPGGYFITQQVGARNDRLLVEKLLGDIPYPFPEHDLIHNVEMLKEAGFAIVEQMEEEPVMKLFDLGATVYFARQIPWEFPAFSVEQCYDRIKALQSELDKNGYIENRTHRFFIVAKKQEI